MDSTQERKEEENTPPRTLPVMLGAALPAALLQTLGAPAWLLIGAAALGAGLATRLPALARRRPPRTPGLRERAAACLFRRGHELALLLDRHHRIVDCNASACERFRLHREALLGRCILDLAEQPAALAGVLDRAAGEAAPGEQLLRLRPGDGRRLELRARLEPLQDAERHLLLLALPLEEGNRVLHLAYHDTLTDLPNRTLLHDRVNHALQRSQRSGQIGALLFLDLDKFKRINDSLGHSVGDLLLQELAERLRRTLREEDTISRLGGDEFVVLLESLGDDPERADRQVMEIGHKIRHALSPAYHLDGHELHVTASIGYVVFPRDGHNMETLLRHADLAMYQAKHAGRDTVTRFQTWMDEAAAQRMRTENDIRRALDQGQLSLHYQPILRIRDGHILGAEALLRWHHPEDGEVLPEQFLPQIEDGALMLRLAEWVLRAACEELARLAASSQMRSPDYLAVNIGHQQFHHQNFIQQVERILEETGADPRHLLFEITETVIMGNAAESRRRLLALKALGIRFAIDDFGTGYSSLAYLKQLPADTLKIDRTFVRNLTRDPDDDAIVRTILGIADHMGLQVIAEGVETREQLQFLRHHGCTSYQGFLGRPPLDDRAFHEELTLGAQLRLVE